MDVLIVHYNTQELTEAAIRSLWKHTPGARVTVFDNSDSRPFCPVADPKGVVTAAGTLAVIDNTRGQIVDWKRWLELWPDKDPSTANGWASARHCFSVELCMDLFPDGFLLMDSDVLIKADVSGMVDRSVAFVGQDRQPTRRFPVPRVLPFLCWINVPMLKKHGIRFFNPDKMWKLTRKVPDNLYDTGAWLLEAVWSAGLPYRLVAIEDYMMHLGSGSWKSRTEPGQWLRDNRALWEGGALAGKTSEHRTAAGNRPAADATGAVERPAADATGVVAGRTARIFICTHADFTPVVSSPVYEVVDARAINGGRCENGLRQSFYSEMFQFRHIAEREDLPEYVGVCHYRRYFEFMDDVPDIDVLFRFYDAVTTMPVRFKRSVREQYARCHNVKDLDIVSDIIRRDYPDLWPTFKLSLEGHTLYACNMMILRREDFRWLVRTVFDIFDKYLEAVMPAADNRPAAGNMPAADNRPAAGNMPAADATGVVAVADPIERRILAHPDDYHIGRPRTGTVQYQYRIAAFLSERIINALLPYRFRRIRHYEKVLTAACLPQQVALCGIGRMENRYAREWVEYHLGQGFNRIIIYDNNREGEERFEDVLQDYVADGRVEVIDFRGRELAQIPAYNDCYRRYGNLFEWIAFLDFDEFLVTDKPLHEWLSEFGDAECVLVNWRVMTDSGLVHDDGRPLRERFTVPLADGVLMRGKYRYNDHVKSIVRGGLQRTEVFGGQMPHVPVSGLRCCTASHRAAECSPFQPCDHRRARIDHYTTKTIEEWLTVKYRRGFPISITKKWRDSWAIPQFWEINERTPEKEAVLREWENGLAAKPAASAAKPPRTGPAALG